MWRADVFTLFPAMFPGPVGMSLAGEALARGLWSCHAFNIRDQGLGRHRTVDDRPAGGGPGMVMRADVLAAALDARLARDDERPRLLMSPRGLPLTQQTVRRLVAGPGVVIVCGRFEGVDERVIAARRLTEVSIGDYILSGGELASLVLLDACVRLLPGVMGAEASGSDESFEHGLLEHPHYTRPRTFEGWNIPEVLLGGDHRKIAAWRRAECLRVTEERRPDLLAPGGFEGRDGTTDVTAPTFTRDFTIEQVEGGSIDVRHRDGSWWRFNVAEKNGRRQLLYADDRADREPDQDFPSKALNAYDTATREARRRGMVD